MSSLTLLSAGGATLDFTGVTLPFTVNQMMVAGMSLIGIVAGLVILNLAFQFVPKFVGMIMSSMRGGGKKA